MTVRKLAAHMYLNAMQMGRLIGQGEEVDDAVIYRIRATIAHCEAALEGRECDPADVYFKGTEKVA